MHSTALECDFSHAGPFAFDPPLMQLEKESLPILPTYQKIQKGAEAASGILGVPLEKMGLTGSLQYGRLEQHDDDTDTVFYQTSA